MLNLSQKTEQCNSGDKLVWPCLGRGIEEATLRAAATLAVALGVVVYGVVAAIRVAA